MTSGLTPELEDLNFNHTDSQENQYEEIEGIKDQCLIGQSEENVLPGTDNGTRSSDQRSIQYSIDLDLSVYKSFIEHLMKQLPTRKRKHAELEYKKLQTGNGK